MQTNYDKNDPGRFLGEGVSFRAKLIGILEVGEARGDRMCQEALCDLKVAIRAAGEHKQRISVHVAIDGLRLRDEKTGDSLYHHPVHKISFIAQDMTDSRAFGYIFGSPDSGHRFFGIKTDKAASQVVIAMRDLFQVVFELKKKEIELARQQIQGKVRSHCESTKSKNQNGESCLFPVAKMATIGEHKPIIIEPSTSKASPESIADLVDLEQELNSLQRGLNEMERLTPSDGPQSAPGGVADPFGDSFATFTPPPCLPPPPSTRERPSRCPEPPFSPPFSPPPVLKTPFSPTPLHQAKPPAKTAEPTTTKSVASPDWLQSEVLDDPLSIDNGKDESSLQGLPFDVFTELDPLGTGRSKPYIDKKHFFQELKNPPKKVLKDLVGGLSSAPADAASLFQANFQEGESNQAQPPVSSAPIVPFTTPSATPKISQSDPFDDPFGQTDPFADTFKPIQTDPFDTDFVGFKIFDTQQINPIRTSNICSSPTLLRKETTILQETKIQHIETSKLDLDGKDNIFNGPLQVSLPPERGSSYISSKSPKLERQTSVQQQSVRTRPTVTKQNTMDSSVTRSKMKPHNILSQKFSKKDVNGSQTQINMSRLQESDSFSESEAPEPPPRPDNMSSTIPPPLPPKKQLTDITIRPPPRPPHTDNESHYDYIDNYNSSTMEAYSKFEQNSMDKSPPLPVPARRSKFDDNFVAPQRPKKSIASAEDDYLTPITLEKRDSRGVQSPKSMLERPILLPPPQKKDPKNSSKLAAKPETKSDIKSETLNITLSELLAYGMEELAVKLKVPASRLSNMTIAELTSYLSNYLATANGNIDEPEVKAEEKKETAIFKADFDNNSTFQTDFKANFNDDFGSNNFVANFDQFNQNSSFDRYAVFREIQEEENKNKVVSTPSPTPLEVEEHEVKREESPPIIIVKPDDEVSRQNTGQESVKSGETETKTQQSSIDRYAALRDIILIDENDNTKNGAEDGDEAQDIENTKSDNLFEKSDLFGSKNNFAMDDNIESSLNKELSRISLNLSQTGLSKSPMNKSPILCKSPNTMTTLESIKTAAQNLAEIQILNASLSITDPESRQPNNKSPIPKSKSPISIIKSPISNMITEVQGQTRLTSGSLSDVISGSSPEIDNITGSPEVKNKELTSTSESWAIFDTPNFNQSQVPKTINQSTSPLPIFNNIPSDGLNSLDSNSTQKELNIPKEEVRSRPLSAENIKPLTLGVFAGENVKVGEKEFYGPGTKTPLSNVPSTVRSRKCEEGMSPWSSDGKEFYGSPPDWSNRGIKECERRRRHRDSGWGKNHTSSSSRDVSPWEEEGQGGDYRRHSGRHESITRRNREILRRRCDSWEEDDYDYDEDSDRINWTDRRSGPTSREKASRSREMLDSRPPWSERHDRPSWNDYPDRDFDDRFDRKSFGTRDSFERKSFERDNFDRSFDNFDRDRDDRSNYYERRKHLGSREFYGSCEEREFDSWENKYRGEERRGEFKHGRKVDNWVAAEREYENRYATVGGRQRRSRGHRDWTPDWTPTADDWEQDSDGVNVTDVGPPSRRVEQRRRRGVRPWTESPSEDLGPSSLQDPQVGRKPWKRPSSASETDRRIDRRNHQGGSDGERDRRFRTKSRSRSRESQFSDSRPQKLESANTLRSRGRHQRYEHPEEQAKAKIKLPSSSQRDFDPDDDSAEKPVTTNKLKQMFFDSDFNDECTKNNFNSNKFDKNDHKLFDADFSQFENSPMSANSAARFRFSNDFSEKESSKSQNSLFENDLSPKKYDSASSIPTKNSKFKFENDFAPEDTSPRHPSTTTEDKFESDLEAESPFKNKIDINQSFEDDFMPENNKSLSRVSENVNFESISEEVDDKSEGKVEFSFTPRKEQNGEQPKANQHKTKTILSRNQTRDLNLRKSESVNIFAREADPFDDDDFFNNGSMQVIENKMATKTAENNDCTSNTDKTEFYKWSGQFDAFDK